MKLVLDTSALFMMECPSDEGELHTTPGVLDELERYRDRRTAYLAHLISVSSPGKEARKRVEEMAERTGDQRRLSKVDREVVALALELDAVILTDDYSIQNLASALGLQFRTVSQQGISKVLKWKLRCRGCGRVFSEPHKECPVCGSELRTYRSRRPND